MDLTRIAIIGLGVMGGSLLQAVKRHIPKCDVAVITRNPVSQDWAKSHGAYFVSSDVSELNEQFDFIFIATPSHSIEKVAQELTSSHQNSIITDLASAKGVISSQLGKIFENHSYLSCHPMCGSEKTGIDGAKLDLYENKMVVLTPHNEKSKELVEPLSQFWGKLNCRISILDPCEHDHCVAWVSHMPHLLMSSLIHALQEAEKEHSKVFDIAGTGLRDIARLAASNPDLWRGIVLENLPAIQKAITGMKEELTQLENLLVSDDEEGKKLFQYLDEANNIHRSKKLDKI